jgi:hypothetical protein
MAGHDEALLMGGLAAVLQRLFQVGAELLMGGIGAVLTRRGQAGKAPVQDAQRDALDAPV